MCQLSSKLVVWQTLTVLNKYYKELFNIYVRTKASDNQKKRQGAMNGSPESQAHFKHNCSTIEELFNTIILKV